MNIIIDVSMFAKRMAWVNSTNEDYLSDSNDRKSLIRSILASVLKIVNRYNNVTRVIYCFDNVNKYSWRYDLPYKNLYKSNRKKSLPKYSYDGYKLMINEFYELLDNNGHYCMMYDRMEADDLIYISSMMLYQSNESVLICTNDADMRQLINNNGNNYISVLFNDGKSYIHYVSKHKSDITAENFFDYSSVDYNKDIIQQHCKIIDPVQSLFCKILSGDKSDCIPSCYQYQKGSQSVGFTELRATQLYEQYYNNKSYDNIFEDIRSLSNNIVNFVDKDPNDVKVDNCGNNIITNIKYIRLHYSSYPEELYDNTENYVIRKLSNPLPVSSILDLINKL